EAPLCDRSLRRYVERADRLIVASVEKDRERAMARHLAQRRALYGKAVLAGDLRTALAVLRDEAQLRWLYPAEAQAPAAAPVVVTVHTTEEVRHADPHPADQARDGAAEPHTPGGPPATNGVARS